MAGRAISKAPWGVAGRVMRVLGPLAGGLHGGENDHAGGGFDGIWHESTGEAHYQAELFRSRGELERHRRADDEAEAHFEQAPATARRQGIKPFELRAAASIARLLRDQGKANEAHDQITPIYDWFTEGFDTPDLKDAKALLDELA